MKLDRIGMSIGGHSWRRASLRGHSVRRSGGHGTVRTGDGERAARPRPEALSVVGGVAGSAALQTERAALTIHESQTQRPTN